MVAAASGHRGATITIGDDVPDVPGHWVIHALTVGHDRVGTLALDPLHVEGPEPRQRRIVAQMLPTVSLATRAVVLAVAAEHSRQDVMRERDAERARILADLHDGLGPALAGLRMRVQARMRSEPTEWLDDVASELAEMRDELRRLVQGLTPAVLDHGDLPCALTGLVDSFRLGGAEVTLDLELDAPPHHDASVAVYRFVAEGITNAIRHASASGIAVHVHSTSSGLEASVTDNGVGGAFTPGVGLTSLRSRADALGGTLSIECAEPHGTRMKMVLPS
jgi:signal transduction histidine kinase